MKKKMTKREKRINFVFNGLKRILWDIMIVSAFIGIFLMTINVLENNGIGIGVLSCDTHSMWPTLQCNSLLVYKLYNQEPYVYRFTGSIFLPNVTYLNSSIKNNTIVLVDFYGASFIHRIIDKCHATVSYDQIIWYDVQSTNEGRSASASGISGYQYDGVVTKGDNNTEPDGCIPLWDIKGELIWNS